MNPFSAEPPDWTEGATHSTRFLCPRCQSDAAHADNAWINRRSPVMMPESRRMWQEFYQCQCGQAWWAWSRDRPPKNDVESPNDDPT